MPPTGECSTDVRPSHLVRSPASPLPPKPTKQPTVDVALGEGGLAVRIDVSAVVLVGGLGAGEGASTGELPDAGWHLPNEAHLDGGQQ